MDFIYKLTISIIVIVLPTWLYQEQNQEWDIVRTLLKSAANNAVHDAALFIDDEEKSRGRLIIDRVAARQAFDETLRLNLGLDTDFKAKPGSRIRGTVRVLHFEVIDESNSTFPMLYENATYNVIRWLSGPSVVAVVEVDHPVVIPRFKTQDPIRVPAIQEYKYNR